MNNVRPRARFTAAAALLAIVCFAPELRAQDTAPLPTVEEVLDRMEKRSVESGLDQFSWRVWCKLSGRAYTQNFGLEVLGRFQRSEGCRTVVTTLGCADAKAHRKATGPNHYVIVHARDFVAVTPIMLLIETPDPSGSFPSLLFRARKGEPGYAEIEPLATPTAVDNLVQVNEPLLHYQLAPRIMFGHEPNLRVEGRRSFANRECLVLTSERNAEALLPRIPPVWSTSRRVFKRFYVDASTYLLHGLDLAFTRPDESDPQGATSYGWLSEVKSRRTFRGKPDATGLELPEDTEVRVTDGRKPLGPALAVRTMEFQTGEFP